MKRAVRTIAVAGISIVALITVVNTWPSEWWPKSRPFIPDHFPAIKDWKSLRIILKRGACLGDCPIYQVEIAGNGSVMLRGANWHGGTDEIHKTISQKQLRALYVAFQKADFYWLYDAYYVPATDLPEDTLEISFDGHSRKVIDYFGRSAGMPIAVTELEIQIDSLVGTREWLKKVAAHEYSEPLPIPPEPSLISAPRVKPPSPPTFDIEPETAPASDSKTKIGAP